MIGTEIQNALNQQINDDYCSWYFYRAAADYCNENNLRGFGKWLRHQSEKKLSQAGKVCDFIVERHGHVEAKPITSENGHWDSPLEILDAALDRERRLGQSASDMVDLSLCQRDHATHDFFEHLVAEQSEAEAKVEIVRDRLKMVADMPGGLFMFDQELAS